MEYNFTYLKIDGNLPLSLLFYLFRETIHITTTIAVPLVGVISLNVHIDKLKVLTFVLIVKFKTLLPNSFLCHSTPHSTKYYRKD